MSGAPDLEGAWSLLQDPGAEVHRRCLAALALGVLAKDSDNLFNMERPESRLGRAIARALDDARSRQTAERREEGFRLAVAGLGDSSPEGLLALLKDRSAAFDVRAKAATALGHLQFREAVPALIGAISEGDSGLSCWASQALNDIGSKRGMRNLIRIASGSPFEYARLFAVYSIWMLHETRGADVLIRMGSNPETETEHNRAMAVETLGNTVYRTQTLRALRRHLFDRSVEVRYSALCALSRFYGKPLPDFVRHALTAKLDDPARLDEHRVVADFARDILNRNRSPQASPALPQGQL